MPSERGVQAPKATGFGSWDLSSMITGGQNRQDWRRRQQNMDQTKSRTKHIAKPVTVHFNHGVGELGDLSEEEWKWNGRPRQASSKDQPFFRIGIVASPTEVLTINMIKPKPILDLSPGQVVFFFAGVSPPYRTQGPATVPRCQLPKSAATKGRKPSLSIQSFMAADASVLTCLEGE